LAQFLLYGEMGNIPLLGRYRNFYTPKAGLQTLREPEAYGPEAYGPKAYGPEAYGPEAYGPEAYGGRSFGVKLLCSVFLTLEEGKNKSQMG
jgi:hypothetical protein